MKNAILPVKTKKVINFPRSKNATKMTAFVFAGDKMFDQKNWAFSKTMRYFVNVFFPDGCFLFF